MVNLNFMLHTHVKSKSGRLPDGTGRTDSDTLYYRSPEHEMALLSLKFFCNSKVFGLTDKQFVKSLSSALNSLTSNGISCSGDR